MKSTIIREADISACLVCAIEYGDYSGLEDSDIEALDLWLEELYAAARDLGGNLYFEYGKEEDFAECDVSGLMSDVISFEAFVLSNEKDGDVRTRC